MTSSRIAIVGVSALFPGSVDATGFWRDILAGKDLITDVPPDHWRVEDYFDEDPKARDKTYSHRGGFIPKLDFDPVEWGVPPSVVPATDTTQLLALIVARQVLEDACGGQFARVPRERTSVILGVTSAQELLGSMVSRLQKPIWVKALREAGLAESKVQEACDRIASQYVEWQESTFPGVLGNVVAGRIANRLDLGGTNCVTDAACASSFSAMSMAVNELRLGDADLVITGGADTMNDIFMYMCFSKTPALSKTGDCRPFSDRADGTILGEGIGMVAMRRLEDAERDGDRIYAVLAGLGSSSDGRSKSVYAPVATGQSKALRRAYEQAGYAPATVELVEAHGTGTTAGDAAEVEALRMVFQDGDRSGWCAIGSIKSQIGHTKAAAGAAGLFKAVMALHHKVLPPTIKVDRPNPALGLEGSAFYVNTRSRPWIPAGAWPRRASVSSFGFGGSNYHLTLEEYAGPAERSAWRLRTAPSELVLVGGESAAALADCCRALAAEAATPGMLEYLARTSQESWDASVAHRLAIVAESEADLVAKLNGAVAQVAAGVPFSAPGGVDYASGAPEGDVALLFPGQGSQYLFMGAELAMTHASARAAWELAAASWSASNGETRLVDAVFPPPAFDDAGTAAQAARIVATEWAQPAIGVASLSILNVLRSCGLEARMVAGHSYGEVTALHAAGVLSAEDFLRVTRKRGSLMSSVAKGRGAMTSVVASAADLKARLEAWGLDLVLANHNGPSQAVLSGGMEAMEEAERRLAAEGVHFQRLEVCTAFHSPIVADACAPFRDFLDGVELHPARMQVFSNTTADLYPEDVRKTLAEQIAKPVRLVEEIEAMYARGARVFVEVGPGNTLTSLVARILKGKPHVAIPTDRRGRSGLTTLHLALGRLAVAGVPLSLGSLWTEYAPAVDPRTRPQPKMALAINGTSYGKPYPAADGSRTMPPPNPEVVPEVRVVEKVVEVPVAAAPSVPADGAWVSAYVETQRQTVEAHTAFQRAMADGHAAFLAAMQSSFGSLGGQMGMPAVAPAPAPVRHVAPAPAVMAAPPPVVQMMAPPPPAFVAPPVPLPVKVEASLPVVAVSADVAGIVQQVVSETTGYPAEMVGMQMDLEADLGVDSIKRVEILAAVQQRVPNLPELQAAKLATLRTLGQIVDYIREQQGGPAATPPAPAPAVAAKRIARRVVELSPAPRTGLVQPGLTRAGRITIVDGGSGVAAALATELEQAGVLAEVGEVRADGRAVIFLGGLAPVEGPDDALRIQRDAFLAAQVVARAETDRVFITVADTTHDSRAWLAGLPGLVKCAALEWPGALVRALDVERGPDVAARIADELLRGGPEVEVTVRADGLRWTPRLVDAPVAAGEARRNGVWVVSGGARGVTAAAVTALARARGGRFLLLGSTRVEEEPASVRGIEDPVQVKQAVMRAANGHAGQITPAQLQAAADVILKNREINRTLAGIRDAGGEAEYVAVDIEDVDAVAAAVSDARAAWGPVTGVVHGAGVLADRRIADKTVEQWDRVMGTKVGGLVALLAATAGDPLETVCLFSSVAARFGNPGQCDYATANAILDRVARGRRGGKSIAWGPWDGGMVTPSLKTHFEKQGVGLIPLEAGAQAFVDELADGSAAQVLVGAALPPREAPAQLELLVDARGYPYLDGHRIGGVPVVPVAMVVEWFARATGAAAFREVKVLRGIKLAHFDGPGDRFVVTMSGDRVELVGEDGALHYSARVDAAGGPARAVARPDGLTPWTGEVYGTTLFHGADFRVIRAVDGTNAGGMSARVVGGAALGWPGQGWATDAGLCDAALQVALLWTEHRVHGASLPTGIDGVRWHRPGMAAGEVTAVLTERSSSDLRVTCDVALVGADGGVIAELVGVATHVLPRDPASTGGARGRDVVA